MLDRADTTREKHLSSRVTAIGLRVFLNFQRLFKYEVDTEVLIYLVRLLPYIYKLIVDTYFAKIYIYIPKNYLCNFEIFPFLVQPMSMLISKKNHHFEKISLPCQFHLKHN